MDKICSRCGNIMRFKKATTGLPDRYVCTNCGHDEVATKTSPSEVKKGKPGMQTLVD